MDIKGPISRSKFQGFDIHSFFTILLVGDLCCFVAGDLALSTPLLDERVDIDCTENRPICTRFAAGPSRIRSAPFLSLQQCTSNLSGIRFPVCRPKSGLPRPPHPPHGQPRRTKETKVKRESAYSSIVAPPPSARRLVRLCVLLLIWIFAVSNLFLCVHGFFLLLFFGCLHTLLTSPLLPNTSARTCYRNTYWRIYLMFVPKGGRPRSSEGCMTMI